MSAWKINPAWQHYSDMYNEGGEGFNPNEKWLPASSSQQTQKKQPEKMSYFNGRLKTKSEVRQALEIEEERLTRITDKIAFEQTKDLIKKQKEFLAQVD